MDCLSSPACKHIVRMVMPGVIMMMIMFVMVTVLPVVMPVVVTVLPVVMPVVMIVLPVVMPVVMIVLPVVMLMVVMSAALSLCMVMSALRADNLIEKFFLQRFARFHRLKDLPARKLRDWRRDKRRFVVEFTEQRNALFDLLRFCLVCTA